MASEPTFELAGPGIGRDKVYAAVVALGYDPAEVSSVEIVAGPRSVVEVVVFVKAPIGGGKKIQFLSEDRKGFVKARITHDMTGPHVVANGEETS